MRTRRFVVGVDGSEGARRAMAWCVDMAADLDVEIVAVHSVETTVYLFAASAVPIPAFADTSVRDQIEAEFEQHWCAPLEVAHVKYRTEFAEGSPASSLMAIAEDVEADGIVVGSRGRGGFGELLLGSVGHQLAHHAKRPVIIVPPAQR